MHADFIAAFNMSSEPHTLTFLANSGKTMVNGLSVDLASLKVPVNTGETKLVKDLTAEDTLTVPLLLDHDWNVRSQAGTVTALALSNEGLEAKAVLSDVDAGELVYDLAKSGALTNSFSISVDYFSEPKNNVIMDAELVEISVVYRGADQRAKFRTVATRKDRGMANEKFELTATEAADLKETIKDMIAKAIDDVTDKTEQEVEDTVEVIEPVEVAKASRIIPEGSLATVSASRGNWIDSHDATLAFERTLLNTDNRGVEAFSKQWGNEVKAHNSSFGIDAGSVDKLVPTEVITKIEDALNTRGSGLWQMFTKTKLDQLTIGNNTVDLSSDDGRAHGYPVDKYGTQKTEEKIRLVSRTLTADYVYKYITLNKGDVRRTQRPGALIDYVVSELPNRIVQTIEKQAIFGKFEDMKQVRGVLTDAKDTTSEWAGSKFAKSVNSTGSVFDFLKASYSVQAAGQKVLVTSAAKVGELLTATDAEGRLILGVPSRQGLADMLGVSQIITPEWWYETDDADALGVVLVPSAYDLVGDTDVESFTNFALSTNTNEYLSEVFVGGGLAKANAAAVILPAASSKATAAK